MSLAWSIGEKSGTEIFDFAPGERKNVNLPAIPLPETDTVLPIRLELLRDGKALTPKAVWNGKVSVIRKYHANGKTAGVLPGDAKAAAKVLESDTFNALTKVLGCGIDKDFDINKLKYDAIMLATDADIDGLLIRSLLCTFFACHMPQIITSGKLYATMPPLYRINEKKAKSYGSDRSYVFDKKEYNTLFHKLIANSLDLAMVHPTNQGQIAAGKGDVIKLSKKEKLVMLDNTIEYLDELRTLQKRAFCNRDVLEYVCYFMVMTSAAPKPHETFIKLLKKKFPELDYDASNQSINGSFNGENISLIVDRIFIKMAARLMKMIAELPTFYILIKNKNSTKDDPKPDDWDLMSYGQFMGFCEKKFHIEIEQRYKGLGEGKANITFPSVMNPKTRRVIRITMADAEDAMKTIQVLHGSTNEMRQVRRDMLDEAYITLQDIDN